MNSSSMRRRLCVFAATGALMGIGAPAAGAATLAPLDHDFGNVTVGSTSPEQAFVLERGVVCAPPPIGICFPEFLVSSAPVSATGDFAVANDDCPDAPPFLAGSNCTANVTFTPTAAGPRSGTVTMGLLSTNVTGTGVVPASSGAGGTQGAVGSQGGSGGKKCKKKRGKKSAVVAKKKCGRNKKK
jgi:hypothetical protein